jgi:heptose I phosphotransferase
MNEQAVQVNYDPRHKPLLSAAGLGNYDAVMNTDAGKKLVKPGLGSRERIRLDLAGADGRPRTYYLKRYHGCTSPAVNEWEGVRLTRAAGAPTMEAAAMGVGPAGGFVIVTAVPGEALERCLEEFMQRRGDPQIQTRLAESLGALLGTLHAAGLCHRDFYTSHVFLHERGGRFDLYVIDLARVFKPAWRLWRWRAKDLAQLRFSLPIGWVLDYWPAVLEAYTRTIGSAVPRRVHLAIERRVRRMKRRLARKSQQEA